MSLEAFEGHWNDARSGGRDQKVVADVVRALEQVPGSGGHCQYAREAVNFALPRMAAGEAWTYFTRFFAEGIERRMWPPKGFPGGPE